MTVESLRYASQTNRVNLAYVQAHVGHRGNERADLLAKRGTEGYGIDHSTSIPQPLNHIKGLVNINIIKMWQDRWRGRKDCRQTKLWFPLIDKRRACGVMHTGRVDFSKCVQLMTGHNYLKRHTSLVDHNDNNLCRLCEEDEETSLHVAAECPALARVRRDICGSHVVEAPLKWSATRLISFLREAHVDELFEQIEG